VISDIHANLEALQAAQQQIEKIGPDKVLCLGDIVGYGASPDECIELSRQLATVTVAGNHDFGVTGQTDITYFNRYAREAVIWTARALSDAGMEYLKELPLSHVDEGHLRIVHATPRNPGRWNYIFTHQQAVDEFKAFDETVCFIGHSHQPCIFELMDADTIIMNSDRVTIREGRKYIVNVGSVGQPRDGDPRGSLCVYDVDAGEITISRFSYDIEAAQQKIRDAGLPTVLANRLSWGE
jgi:diadenosine tetraphosphatase ApaH/serine/threonine PP2A family protein phosphatase